MTVSAFYSLVEKRELQLGLWRSLSTKPYRATFGSRTGHHKKALTSSKMHPEVQNTLQQARLHNTVENRKYSSFATSVRTESCWLLRLRKLSSLIHGVANL